MRHQASNLFKALVFIIPIPLVVLSFYSSGDSQWTWLSNVCEIILFSYGLIGVICGFMKYAIKKESGPVSSWLGYLQKSENDRLISASKPKSSGKNLFVPFLFIAIAGIGVFIYGISVAVGNGSGADVRTNSPLQVEKSGLYTLWISQIDQSTTADQFRMVRTEDSKSFEGHPLSTSASYRRNGEKFVAVCEFQFSTPGSYRLSVPDNYKHFEMLLQQSVATNLILLIILSFVLGAGSLLTSVYLFWREKLKFKIMTLPN